MHLCNPLEIPNSKSQCVQKRRLTNTEPFFTALLSLTHYLSFFMRLLPLRTCLLKRQVSFQRFYHVLPNKVGIQLTRDQQGSIHN